MQASDWSFIINWLLRYYFPVLILIPVTLTLISIEKRVVYQNRNTVFVLCLMLLVLMLVDVFGEVLSTRPHPSKWRIFFSALGFSLRPACLLPLLTETIPGIRQHRKKLLLLTVPAILNMLVFFSAFFIPLAFSYDESNHYHRGPLFFVAILVSAVYMVLLAYFSITQIQRRNRRKSLTILMLTCACFLASIMEINAIAYPAPLLNQTIAIGTTLYYLLQYMTGSSEMIENMTLSLLLMQIRPHFINNSLAAIRGMIRKDPDEAVEALNHFSGYLQDSMNSVLKTNLIPFSQEMDLIDNYLYMEQTRFRNSITVIRDLMPADFPVPPLTVQPLVENAVRHGLRGIQVPGQLTIRTEKDAKEYRIIVIDNGCGFDPTQPPDPSRPHVGLKNVRSRLELMCSGTLSIQSGPQGTTATIHIPAKALGTLYAGAKNTQS